MIRKLMFGMVARPPEQPIIIVKAPKGTFRAPWDAAKAVTELRTTLQSDQLDLEVVVMDGDPDKNPKLFGGSAGTSTYVRSVLGTIADPTYAWTPVSLDC